MINDEDDDDDDNDDDNNDDDNDNDDDDGRLQLGPGRPALQQQVLQAHGRHTRQADM